MSCPVSSRGNQGDHRARPFLPLSGRRGANLECVTFTRKERTVDTIAAACKAAKEPA